MFEITDKNKLPPSVMLNNTEKEYYLNFIIIKCYSFFGTPYYTIVNPATNVHVHAKSLKIARNICDEADFFIKYGFFRTRKIDIMNRSGKLALRTVVDRRRHKHGKL